MGYSILKVVMTPEEIELIDSTGHSIVVDRITFIKLYEALMTL